MRLLPLPRLAGVLMESEVEDSSHSGWGSSLGGAAQGARGGRSKVWWLEVGRS